MAAIQHGPVRRRRPLSRPAVIVLVGACLSCTDPGRDTPRATPPPISPTKVADEDRLEHLRALGYVQWDENAQTALKGVTRNDSARASPGYNLYTNDVDEAYLMDLAGNRVHTWRLPGKRHWEHAELLDDGRLIAVSVGQALTVLDWNSKPVWELVKPVHHDFDRYADGSFLVPYHEPGRHYRGRPVIFDAIAHVSPEGKVLTYWSTFDHLDELKRHHSSSQLDTPPAPGEVVDPRKRYEYYHLNTIEILPDTPLGRRDARFRAGNLLTCLRNTDTILVLDGKDRSVVWSWGPGVLELPHMPTMLPDGNILVFDNGRRRGASRVLEIDPPSGEIRWRYEGTPPKSFFSAWRGSNQRLPNGNTLICESERGRAFEVTPDGAIVWEFWNPEMREGTRKRIYRLERLPTSRVQPLLAKAGAR